MTNPTHEKTYQFAVNQIGIDYVTESSQDTSAKQAMLLIKNSLKGFATLPWVVQSSCDGSGGAGSFGNGDLNDRWLDTGDIIGNTAGSNHSWIVLRHGGGMPGNFELCIDCNSSFSAFRRLSLIISPSAGFGAANGGADGTATARPTATDEDVFLNTLDWWTATTTNRRHNVHVMQSTDGEVTRVLGHVNGRFNLYLVMERPKSPHPSWSPAAHWYHARTSETSTTMLYGVFNDGAFGRFRQTGVGVGTLFYTTLGAAAQAVGEISFAGGNHIKTKQISATPIILGSQTASLNGLWGAVYDLYAAPNWTLDLTALGGAGKSWIMCGNLWLPWDDTAGAPRRF